MPSHIIYKHYIKQKLATDTKLLIESAIWVSLGWSVPYLKKSKKPMQQQKNLKTKKIILI
jgi:hypothetical protein